MRTRIIASSVATLLLLFAAPALAGHTYVGAAEATGLVLSSGGSTLRIGSSEAAVQSAASDDGCGTTRGNACARAAGAVGIGTAAEAHAPGSPGPRDVAAFPLPPTVAPLLAGEVGAARAQASTAAHARDARATAGGIGANFSASPELAASPELQAAVEAIAATLPPAEEGDPDEVLEAVRTAVDQLLIDPAAMPLLRISGGSSTAAAADPGGVTTATATTGETVLVLAPTARSTPADPEGLVILEIGASSVTARSDQRRGTVDVDPAPVTMSVYDPVARDYDVREVAAGASACAAEGTPLETCVAVGAPREAVEGAGAAATSAGVTVRALASPAVPLELALGEATAAVASAPPRPAPTTPVPSRRLPATGGDLLATLPAGELALLLVGLGVLGTVIGIRRRRAA